jgi:hypothetical protein
LALTRDDNAFRAFGLSVGRADVAIGGLSQWGSAIGPQVHAERFGGRAALSITAVGVDPDVPVEVVSGGRVEKAMVRAKAGTSGVGERHVFFETEDPASGDDAIEHEIHWGSVADVPASGFVDFEVQTTPGAEIIYQPPLTQQQKDNGDYRPPEMEGGFVVYHNQAGRFVGHDGAELVNFETGKIANLCRMFVRNDDGDIAWCDMSRTGNVIRAALPMDFILQSGGSPVLGPTFGYSSVGGSRFVRSDARCGVGSSITHTASTGDVVTGLTAYCQEQSTTDMALGIYDISGGQPNNRISGEESATAGSSPGWQSTATLSIGLTNSTTYGCAWGKPGVYRYYDVGSGNETSRDFYSTGLRDPWLHSTFFANKYSLYATYEVAPTGRVPYEYYYR